MCLISTRGVTGYGNFDLNILLSQYNTLGGDKVSMLT